MSRSISSPMSSSRAASQSGMACCCCSMSKASISCLRSSIGRRRRWSRARRLAAVISQAPGFSGTPVVGHCSRAATRASWVNSSASGTSRSILARLVISRGCSIRQTARIARWASATVMAADDAGGTLASRACEGAKLACPFPTRHEVLVELHELPRGRHGFLLAGQLEDRIAANDLLGLHERAVDDAELPVDYPHLCARGERHQPAAVEHAACLDLPIGELVHRLHEFRRRGTTVGGRDYEHEAHLKTPPEASHRRHRRGTVSLFKSTNQPAADRRAHRNKLRPALPARQAPCVGPRLCRPA